jgi:Family of unknown function (DUF6011)
VGDGFVVAPPPDDDGPTVWCRACRRRLTDPVSRERRIGPVCWAKTQDVGEQMSKKQDPRVIPFPFERLDLFSRLCAALLRRALALLESRSQEGTT